MQLEWQGRKKPKPKAKAEPKKPLYLGKKFVPLGVKHNLRWYKYVDTLRLGPLNTAWLFPHPDTFAGLSSQDTHLVSRGKRTATVVEMWKLQRNESRLSEG